MDQIHEIDACAGAFILVRKSAGEKVPWPYPSSLMIGCTARATNEDIVVDRTELEDARWFDHAEATLMLKRQHPDGLAGPHPFAIAHHLLGRWVHHRNPLDQ